MLYLKVGFNVLKLLSHKHKNRFIISISIRYFCRIRKNIEFIFSRADLVDYKLHLNRQEKKFCLYCLILRAFIFSQPHYEPSRFLYTDRELGPGGPAEALFRIKKVEIIFFLTSVRTGEILEKNKQNRGVESPKLSGV